MCLDCKILRGTSRDYTLNLISQKFKYEVLNIMYNSHDVKFINVTFHLLIYECPDLWKL